MSEKRCRKCGESKPLEEFHRDRRNSDGLQAWCKVCKAEKDRAYYAANRERREETNRAYYVANRERLIEYSRSWREANPERVADLKRTWTEANPDKVTEYNARNRAKYPERYAARKEVYKAVMRGDFPPASALVCDCCQEAQAAEWHHHLGYEPEHALDVIPVCIPCHIELDKEVN